MRGMRRTAVSGILFSGSRLVQERHKTVRIVNGKPPACLPVHCGRSQKRSAMEVKMKNMLYGEWMKIRRCQILLVGLTALGLCPGVQYGGQFLLAPEYRDQNFDFVRLCASVTWGNTQMFLPLSLVMIGGWLIDREAAADTWKNILAIPVSRTALLGSKLVVTEALAFLFGLYSIAVTLLTAVAVGLPGVSPAALLRGGAGILSAALLTGLVCMPLILLFGQRRGAYLGGAIAAFFLGYSMLFFKGGFLLSAYPFSAALILTGFDMAEYNGAVCAPSIPLACLGMGTVLVLTGALLILYGRRGREADRCPGLGKEKSRGGRRKFRGKAGRG